MELMRALILWLLLLAMALGVSNAAAAQAPGTWQNVTPSNANLGTGLSCGSYGAATATNDPTNPSNFYATFDCQGVWKSTDFGQSWSGPINALTSAGSAADCAGAIAIAGKGAGQAPTIYQSCIRGSTGFWRSLDGGVNWTRYSIGVAPANRQDVYAPVIDPYDAQHLLVTAHELNGIYESINGGQTWTNVARNAGMNTNGGTAFVFFINTGSAATTRMTWLWSAQAEGTGVGTWRTTNSGASWVKVDRNEHEHGGMRIYQPDNNGVVYMAGVYSSLGWGVLRSTNYGATWAHVGLSTNESIVFGTPNNVYADRGIGGSRSTLMVAPQPGLTGWAQPSVPFGVSISTAGIAYDGSNYVIVTSHSTAGLWRYVEPWSGPTPTATPTATIASTTSTPTAVPSTSTPVPTSTLVVTASTSTPTSVATNTPMATATSASETCTVQATLDGVARTFTRPLAFCSDQ